jgi:hypothetical protein
MEGFNFVTPVTGLNRPNTGNEEDDDDDDENGELRSMFASKREYVKKTGENFIIYKFQLFLR